MSQFGGLIPARYILPETPIKYDEVIIVGWLDLEVDARAPERMPILNKLSGHRRRDVYGFIKKTNDDWFNALAVKMYGRSA